MKIHEINNKTPLQFYKNSSNYFLWTFEKELFLFNNYEKSSIETLTTYLNMSWSVIKSRAVILGYKRSFYNISKETSLEIKVSELLKSCNINFETQYKIKYNNKYSYIIDFYIKDNICIEAQGDYWHGNPKRFPNLTHFQKLRVQNDLLRKQRLEFLGYKVIYIWEYDVKHNYNYVLNLIKKELCLP